MRILCTVLISILLLPFAVLVEAKNLKIGFVYVSPVSYAGWSYSHEQVRMKLEKLPGIRTSYVENVALSSDAERIFKSMALAGTDIIVSTSFSYLDSMIKVSKQFPDVQFIQCSGFKFGDNMSSYMGRMYQARYLSGIVAGAMTKSDNIGYVAAFPIPEVIRGINAFTLGVQSVDPKIKVHAIWTNTWYDPEIEKEAAKSLIAAGCDVLAQHQDTSTVQEVAEKYKIYSIGYHSDMSDIAPNAHLTATVWNWEPIYKTIIEKIRNNTWKHGSYWYGLDIKAIGLSPYNKAVPQEVRDLVEQAQNKISAGNLTIFEGPIKDQKGQLRIPAGIKLNDEELINMSWFVDGVIGQVE